MEMWSERITRENLTDFYYSTIEMVYPSTYSICKETTRTEQAIIKSYVDIFHQRQQVAGEDVLYVFGDILLKNANETVERYELPEGLMAEERLLDEYTRNSMLEKINAKIDSRSFKVAEFISSDAKKIKNGGGPRLTLFNVAVTPLLVFHMVVLALLIWGISYVAITMPYRNNELVTEKNLYDSIPLQEKYVSILDYLPLNVMFEKAVETEEENVPVPSETEELTPSLDNTEPSATRG